MNEGVRKEGCVCGETFYVDPIPVDRTTRRGAHEVDCPGCGRTHRYWVQRSKPV